MNPSDLTLDKLLKMIGDANRIAEWGIKVTFEVLKLVHEKAITDEVASKILQCSVEEIKAYVFLRYGEEE